jgi:hypothetical protein
MNTRAAERSAAPGRRASSVDQSAKNHFRQLLELQVCWMSRLSVATAARHLPLKRLTIAISAFRLQFLDVG